MAVDTLTVTYVTIAWLCVAAGAGATCPDGCSCSVSSQSSADSERRRGLTVTCADVELTSMPAKLPNNAVAFDVSGNRLEALDSESLSQNGVHGLSSANFSRNRIVTIATESFSEWSSLVSLDLSANRLSSIDHGTFRGAPQTSLQNLDLSGNRLTDVDGGFSGMTNLFRLDLRNNYLTSLTEFTFRDLSGLRYLFLTNNRIYRIDRRALRQLHHLLYLVLRGNPLAEIDRLHFHTPSTLSYIDMSECGLTTVPRGLPASLRYVQLRRNNLTILNSDTFSECPHVNILVLDENKIQTVHNGTFSAMSRLQQLWLNENQLRSLPRPLPASLRRLLVDGNHLETATDSDTFPVRSQMTTLSLAGNQLHRVSPTVLQRLTHLQSLDISNNQLRRIDAATFSANTHLRSLSLGKNPLDTIQKGAFDELHSLKVLTLSYVPTIDIQLSAADLFRPMDRLSRLDLDNSPGIAKAVLWQSLDDDDRPSHVEELGLVNCDLTMLPRDFPLRFPRLSALRISSSRWHCDRALMWFRDWLLDPGVDVRVQSLPDIRCATPRSVRHRPLVSLNDDEFIETTTTSPQPTSTTTTSTVKPKTRTSPTQLTEQLRHKSTVSLLDDEVEEVKTRQPSTQHAVGVNDDITRTSSVKQDAGAINSRPTASLTASTSDHPPHKTKHRPHHHHSKDDDEEQFKTRLIIAVVTIGVTIVIAALIVAAIIYFWRRNRKPLYSSTPPPPPLSAAAYDDDSLANGTTGSSTPRTFIKYKNKNGVLFFSTPADSPSTLTTGAVSDDVTPDSCLIGETGTDGTGTIRYVLPPSSTGFKTRVYRWEDF